MTPPIQRPRFVTGVPAPTAATKIAFAPAKVPAPQTPAATSFVKEIKSERSEVLFAWLLQNDLACPLEYFSPVISRSAAFKACGEGRLQLTKARGRAAVMPSQLLKFLKSIQTP